MRRLQQALQIRRAAKFEMETMQIVAETVRGIHPVPRRIERKAAAYRQWTGRMPPERLPEPAGDDAPLAS